MKKGLVLIIVSILLTCMLGSAIAEDFALHSGVTFGMTMDEVERIETEKGFTVTRSHSQFAFYTELGEYKAKSCDVLIISGSMAGIGGSTLTYYFDDNGLLVTSLYEFGEHNLSSYNQIQDLINNKYVNRETDDYSCPLVSDILLMNNSIYSNFQEFLNGSIGIDQEIYHCYTESFVPLDNDNRVYIVHMMCHPNVPGYDDELNQLFGGEHYLEYHYISTDELKTIQEAKDGKTKRETEEKERKEQEAERQRQDDI